ncbi:MAG: hypothetical protein C0399_10480 [Syntrophus sp. (in: bacteria)]|nr:hypothetical protein [Syntrophus sp. (in: bacteria)]
MPAKQNRYNIRRARQPSLVPQDFEAKRFFIHQQKMSGLPQYQPFTTVSAGKLTLTRGVNLYINIFNVIFLYYIWRVYVGKP